MANNLVKKYLTLIFWKIIQTQKMERILGNLGTFTKNRFSNIFKSLQNLFGHLVEIIA